MSPVQCRRFCTFVRCVPETRVLKRSASTCSFSTMTDIVLWHVPVDLVFVKGTLPFNGGPIRQGKRKFRTVLNRFQKQTKKLMYPRIFIGCFHCFVLLTHRLLCFKCIYCRDMSLCHRTLPSLASAARWSFHYFLVLCLL